MKCFLITMIFFSISVIAYSQTTIPLPKSLQGYKNNLPVPSTFKNYIITPGTGNNSKNTVQNNMPCYKSDMSVISIIPTLKLWLLQNNIPNPFMKDDD